MQFLEKAKLKKQKADLWLARGLGTGIDYKRAQEDFWGQGTCFFLLFFRRTTFFE